MEWGHLILECHVNEQQKVDVADESTGGGAIAEQGGKILYCPARLYA